MVNLGTIEAARRALGPVGAFLPVSFTVSPPIDQQRDAVRRLEAAGYPAAWTNEVIGGKDTLVQLGVLLAATDRMVFGTGIANIWSRPPQTMHAAAALLAQAFPGRFLLGLGVGYAEQAESVGRQFGRPLATMREYLDRMNTPTSPPTPDVAYPTIVGANGPKMLALAGELADGALPAMVTPEFTTRARQVLGPEKLLAVFVDTSIGKNDPATIAAAVREHLSAGADHVMVKPADDDYADGIARLVDLAAWLLGATQRR